MKRILINLGLAALWGIVVSLYGNYLEVPLWLQLTIAFIGSYYIGKLEEAPAQTLAEEKSKEENGK